MIGTRITHVPTELGQQGYARLEFSFDGVQFAHYNFGSDNPTAAECRSARQSLAYQLYHNPHFAQYHKHLWRMAYPYGE